MQVPYNIIYWPLPAAEGSSNVPSAAEINLKCGEMADNVSSEKEVLEKPSSDMCSSPSDVISSEISNLFSDENPVLNPSSDPDLAFLAVFEQGSKIASEAENVSYDIQARNEDSIDNEVVGAATCDTDSSSYDETSSEADSDDGRSSNRTAGDSDTRSESEEESSGSSDFEGSDSNVKLGSLQIYEGCTLTVDEGVYLLMDLFMTQNLSKTTLVFFESYSELYS